MDMGAIVPDKALEKNCTLQTSKTVMLGNRKPALGKTTLEFYRFFL
jgi:hypothetical protein